MKYPLYNDELCPDLWELKGKRWVMKADVHETLMKIATDFIEVHMEEEALLKITPVDFIVIGSSTNFNWTQFSDIDFHIIVDFKELEGIDHEKAEILMNVIKSNWNKSHEISIKGHDVEIYIQDITLEPASASIYSVMNNEWVVEPDHNSPKFNKKLIKQKHKMFSSEIKKLIASKDVEKIRKMIAKLYKFRQAGLDNKKGEYSEENIVFKILRAQGYLDKMKEFSVEVYDKELTLLEQQELKDGIVVGKPIKKRGKDGKPLKKIGKNGKEEDDERGNINVFPDQHNDLIPTEDDYSKRVWEYQGIEVFGAYRVEPKGVEIERKKAEENGVDFSEFMKNIRKSIKNPGNDSREAMKYLINKAIDRFINQVDTSNIKLIIPVGSSSKLNNVLCEKLRNKIPGSIVLTDFIKKTTWKNVTMSDIWKREVRNNNGTARQGAQDALDFLKKKQEKWPNETFAVSKVGRMGSRRYYSNFFVTPKGTVDVLKQFEEGEVLLVDDTMEEGASLTDAIRSIKQFEPKKISAFIFLYGKGSKA